MRKGVEGINPFTAVAGDPLQRMLKVHAHSLRNSQASRCCEPTARDSMQCRIVVNALRREIDRLLRGIDPFPTYVPRCSPAASSDTIVAMNDAPLSEHAKLSSASTKRKLYAVASVGDAANNLVRLAAGVTTPGVAAAATRGSDAAGTRGSLIDVIT